MISPIIASTIEWVAGITPQQMATIEARLPTLKKLIDIVNEAKPEILAALPHIQKIEPLIPQALAEITAITPAAEIVIAIAEKASK